MIWSHFLHIYQPADQQPDILEAIVAQSYRPLLKGFKENSKIRLTFNVTGSLLELFDKYGYRDLIDILRELGKEGRIEFTGSAKYHALLPFLNEDEIIRQVKINDETGKYYLGNGYKPSGFFPPEMAYSETVAKVVAELGYKWLILDEIAYDGQTGRVDYTKTYRVKGTKLGIFFRERRLSNLIMSAVVRSKESLLETMTGDLTSGRYIVTAMDGETFGHHRPGLEKSLFDIFTAKEFEWKTISEISGRFPEVVEMTPIASTWASSGEDINNNIQFLSWRDPENPIHGWQWELLELVLDSVYALDKTSSSFTEIRKKMDAALASDHFWWASAKPWWSLEMIEDGAFRLLELLREIPSASKDKLNRAAGLYEKIVSTSFNWQRTGKIREAAKKRNEITLIPFYERTVAKGGQEEGVFHAFIKMMKDLENKAAVSGEYEKAILWRDAVFKLENKLDIYDTVNAIDLVRLELPHDEIEELVKKYKEKYAFIRGGQPEQRHI